MENTITNEYIELEVANEAYISATILKNQIKTKETAFYFFACMNLINAYIKREYAEDIYKKRYIIKDYVALAITQIIDNNIDGIDIYLDENIAYITIEERQFSFHNVKRDRTMNAYKNSKKNKKQEWCGLRLQPICVSVYKEAKYIIKARERK